MLSSPTRMFDASVRGQAIHIVMCCPTRLGCVMSVWPSTCMHVRASRCHVCFIHHACICVRADAMYKRHHPWTWTLDSPRPGPYGQTSAGGWQQVPCMLDASCVMHGVHPFLNYYRAQSSVVPEMVPCIMILCLCGTGTLSL